MFYTFLKNPAAETLLGHSLELMAREIGKMPECSGVRAVVLGGGLREGENEFPAVCAEDIIHLLIEAVDVEAGDAGG